MKNINYILTFGGWIGFVVTLIIVIFTNKCGSPTPQVINNKTEIHQYYDSSIKVVPQKSIIKGDPIFVPVPADVDTAKILALYYAKFPQARVFQDSNLIATLKDTLSKNSFLSPGQFTYQWLKPVKTVISTTTTVEAPKKMALMIGAHANFNKALFTDFGPDVYLKTKRDQLVGLGYDFRSQEINVKAATSISNLFKSKK